MFYMLGWPLLLFAIGLQAQEPAPSAAAQGDAPGEVHLRHHISPSGVYRGKKVVKAKGE